MKNRLYLASPHMCGEEMKFVREAFDTNWIAPLGKNVDEFEREVAAKVGVPYAAALSAGTAAIHLALKWFGVKQGDTVFCSALTFSGSCNAIAYEKAEPIFIDSEPDTYNMSPLALKRAFEQAEKRGKLPKCVIIVNLYGAPADFGKLLPICRQYGVPVLEDAAESFGAEYDGKMTGAFGDLAILSFNGNKIITTSGGGMLLGKDSRAIEKARFWATQSRDPAPHYQHSEIGYNYRMSNVCAGIGRGQLTVLDERVAQKRAIHTRYAQAFAPGSRFRIVSSPVGKPTYWLSIGRLDDSAGCSPADLYEALNKHNVESRPVWKPMNRQPVFAGCEFYAHYENGESVGDGLFENGLCLPSDTKMTAEQQQEVIEILKKAMGD